MFAFANLLVSAGLVDWIWSPRMSRLYARMKSNNLALEILFQRLRMP